MPIDVRQGHLPHLYVEQRIKARDLMGILTTVNGRIDFIAIEMPTATVAMFSTIEYINTPNFEKFRQAWNASYLGGFVVHNQATICFYCRLPVAHRDANAIAAQAGGA